MNERLRNAVPQAATGRRVSPCAWLGLIIAVWVVVGEAPSAAEPPQAPQAPNIEGAVQYVGPDTYILLDSQGRPQPVLGMTYDDFVEAWKKSQHIEAQATTRRFTIEELQVEGAAKEEHAELEARITIRPLTSGRISIPLGMATAILRDQPQWETLDQAAAAARDDAKPASQPAVQFDPELGGFVADFNGAVDVRQRLTLHMLVPLVRDGNST